ncbi:prolipoprotein diacylglyceryl transferase family protein [Nitrospina gracilis]|uniref:prolipoprotein diacylglyceryl transferase family protein n=1 Tax=Nitrospina gracilis TaxID=35801 RepID=UPI001F01779D|nr:prolipoprotein diacylglyceryl transferase family protein [Nitrospina gracilis]MCF8720981.1 prolipoprotein diacylglyceryltransferase [Nitrospina gracilis Nb-211]
MTGNWIFCAGLIFFSTVYLYMGCKYLPRERFQFLAVIPVRKREDGSWESLNLTYYGLLTASALGLGVMVFFTLSTGAGAALESSLLFLTLVVVAGLIAARAFSQWVEGKRHTFTTQGAFWAGGALALPVLALINALPENFHVDPLPMLPVFAALTVGYCLAEGWGRLACMSFGCCYGDPLHEMPLWLRRLFENHCFRFEGATKKIAYAQGWENVPVFPIQALTAALHLVGGSIALAFFLASEFLIAFWVSVGVSQGWRFASEFLRRDHRGAGRWSVYQKGALVALAYAGLLGWILPETEMKVIVAGAWPSILQWKTVLWTLTFSIVTFLYMGRSQVTESQVTFRVRADRI